MIVRVKLALRLLRMQARLICPRRLHYKSERSSRSKGRPFMEEQIVYLNGSFVAENQAKVSVLD